MNLIRKPQLAILAVTLLLGLSTPMVAQALTSLFGEGPSPLPVDEAFVSSAEVVGDNSLRVQFDIEPEYYLYKKKLSFSSDNDDISIGSPTFSKATTHEDEFFGTSLVYRDDATIELPVQRKGSANELTLTVHYQGCADMGICYPPSTADFKLTLPVAPSTAVSDIAQANEAIPSFKNKPSKLSELLNSTFLGSESGSGDELLTPQQAFIPNITIGSNNQFDVNWLIEPGYYLYRDKLKFELVNAAKANIENIEKDEGTIQNDAFFGDVHVYRHTANAKLAINSEQAYPNADLKIYYQGCADIGVCFPPEEINVPVSIMAKVATLSTAAVSETATVQTTNLIASTNDDTNANANTNTNTNTISNSSDTNSETRGRIITEQAKLSTLLSGKNYWLIILSFYAAGLLLAFTACVYPMIPILSSIIVGQGESLSTFKAFNLSLVYVLSMASVYAVVGVLVGLSGFNIQPLFQNPWVLSAFALLFVILAISMFGVFELKMPSAIQERLVSASNKQSGGKWLGVSTMGMLSALIVGPCVTAPLVAALAFIAKTGDALIGGVALFSIGMGMGTPLLLIGTSAGKLMPKAGGWMTSIQRFFGVVLLGVAVSMLARFLPAQATMLLSSTVILFGAVLFGLVNKLDDAAPVGQRLLKTLVLIAALYSGALIVGALSGNNSYITPLKGLASQSVSQNSGQQTELIFQKIKGVNGLETALQQAKNNNQNVMLDFYADWCVSCKEMEAFTFTDKTVIAQLENTLLLKADVTLNDDQDKALLKRFGIFGPPAILFFDKQSNEQTDARVVGFLPAKKFSAHLDLVLAL